jgi:hypothetical protein
MNQVDIMESGAGLGAGFGDVLVVGDKETTIDDGGKESVMTIIDSGKIRAPNRLPSFYDGRDSATGQIYRKCFGPGPKCQPHGNWWPKTVDFFYSKPPYGLDIRCKSCQCYVANQRRSRQVPTHSFIHSFVHC